PPLEDRVEEECIERDRHPDPDAYPHRESGTRRYDCDRGCRTGSDRRHDGDDERDYEPTGHRPSMTSEKYSSSCVTTDGHEYCSALRNPASRIDTSSRSSDSICTIASAKACTSWGTSSPSGPSRSRYPTLSVATMGVPQAMASSSVMPNDALLMGEQNRSAVA